MTASVGVNAGAAGAVALGGDRPALRADQVRPADGVAALCVGGLGLARSVQDEDLAEQILASCRKAARQILAGEDEPLGKARPRRKRNGKGR